MSILNDENAVLEANELAEGTVVFDLPLTSLTREQIIAALIILYTADTDTFCKEIRGGKR